MSDQWKVIRVFLASPGDLDEERRVAKETVDEINKTWFESLGYHVELMGWEDTVAVFGRAQAIINQDVERCELFIGILWKRWGTPPAKSGPYTSGFQEEFEISVERRRKTNQPEISLFFKKVHPAQHSDPGPEFQKVLAFQKKLRDENTVIYQTFDDVHDFGRKLVRCVSQYVQRMRAAEVEKVADQQQSLPVLSAQANDVSAPAVRSNHPLSSEGVLFLRDLIDRNEQDGRIHISPLDVARFRLLADNLHAQGNDERSLGVHDANLLFANRQLVELGRRETFALIDAGCTHFKDENVPLWHWLAATNQPETNLALSAMVGPDFKRVGALRAMTFVEVPVYTANKVERSFSIELWLNSQNDAVRVAALEYLGECGVQADIGYVQRELNRENYETSRPATEAILRIMRRTSQCEALERLFTVQPPSLRDAVVEEIFADGDSVPTDTIAKGLGHKAVSVRRKCSQLLEQRGALTDEMADLLVQDSDVQVRYTAIVHLYQSGRKFTVGGARLLLVRPRVGGLIGFSRDGTDDDYFDEFRDRLFRSMPDRELEQAAASESIYDRSANFALVERRFGEFGAALREDIADEFRRAFDSAVAATPPAQADTLRDSERYIRNELMRRALEVLSRKGGANDLALVRTVLREGTVGYSKAIVEFLRKYGDFADIDLIVAMSENTAAWTFSILPRRREEEKDSVVAQAILSLGRDRLPEILARKLPADVHENLIHLIPNTIFRRLANTTIRTLFQHPTDSVRRATVLKCLRAFARSRLVSFLADYMSKDAHRFYNVIHWLDFGIAAPRHLMLAGVSKLLGSRA